MPKIHAKEKKRRHILRAQHFRCWLCEKPLSYGDATFDHILPKTYGGGASWDNLKLACMPCNSARGRSMDAVFVDVGDVRALRWNVRSIG